VRKSDRKNNCKNDTEKMLTKVPDDSVLGITVAVIGVLLIVLLIVPVTVCLVVVVSVTLDDDGCGDSVFVVIGVDSVTGRVQTYVIYTLSKRLVSFVQRFVVFRKLERMMFILPPKCQRCPHFSLFTIVHISAEKRP